jgi:hypothetical protein
VVNGLDLNLHIQSSNGFGLASSNLLVYTCSSTPCNFLTFKSVIVVYNSLIFLPRSMHMGPAIFVRQEHTIHQTTSFSCLTGFVALMVGCSVGQVCPPFFAGRRPHNASALPHVRNINTSQQHIDLQFSPDQIKLLGPLQVSVRKQSRAGSALPMRFSLRLLGLTQLLPV